MVLLLLNKIVAILASSPLYHIYNWQVLSVSLYTDIGIGSLCCLTICLILLIRYGIDIVTKILLSHSHTRNSSIHTYHKENFNKEAPPRKKNWSSCLPTRRKEDQNHRETDRVYRFWRTKCTKDRFRRLDISFFRY